MLLPAKEFSGYPVFEGFDKLVHCGIFFVLTTLLYWAVIHSTDRKANKWITLFTIVTVTVGFAILTELAQKYLSPTRSADVWDIFADAVGLGMSSFAFVLFYKRRKSRT